MARRRALLEKERLFYLISLEKLKIIHFIYYRNYYKIEQFIYQKIRTIYYQKIYLSKLILR